MSTQTLCRLSCLWCLLQRRRSGDAQHESPSSSSSLPRGLTSHTPSSPEQKSKSSRIFRVLGRQHCRPWPNPPWPVVLASGHAAVSYPSHFDARPLPHPSTKRFLLQHGRQRLRFLVFCTWPRSHATASRARPAPARALNLASSAPARPPLPVASASVGRSPARAPSCSPVCLADTSLWLALFFSSSASPCCFALALLTPSLPAFGDPLSCFQYPTNPVRLALLGSFGPAARPPWILLSHTRSDGLRRSTPMPSGRPRALPSGTPWTPAWPLQNQSQDRAGRPSGVPSPSSPSPPTASPSPRLPHPLPPPSLLGRAGRILASPRLASRPHSPKSPPPLSSIIKIPRPANGSKSTLGRPRSLTPPWPTASPPPAPHPPSTETRHPA